MFSILSSTLSRFWSWCLASSLGSVMASSDRDEYLDQIAYFAMVGGIVTKAANVDLILFNLFWRLSGCKLAVASSIYYAVEATAVKTRMIRQMVPFAANTQERPLIDEIIDAAEKANKQRMQIAHSAQITTSEGQVRSANPKHMKNPLRGTDKKALEPIVDDVTAQVVRAEAAYADFCRMRGVTSTPQIAKHVG